LAIITPSGITATSTSATSTASNAPFFTYGFIVSVATYDDWINPVSLQQIRQTVLAALPNVTVLVNQTLISTCNYNATNFAYPLYVCIVSPVAFQYTAFQNTEVTATAVAATAVAQVAAERQTALVPVLLGVGLGMLGLFIVLGAIKVCRNHRNHKKQRILKSSVIRALPKRLSSVRSIMPIYDPQESQQSQQSQSQSQSQSQQKPDAQEISVKDAHMSKTIVYRSDSMRRSVMSFHPIAEKQRKKDVWTTEDSD